VQSHINLTGHITDALLTIVGGPRWGSLSEADREALETVLDDAADCATDQIIQAEEELVTWFGDQGVTVNEVDRTPFREATMELHMGDMATWSQETYDRLQAIE
jgi:TRAP-type C4-dicarboxylate transport system substrate-binding protein